MLFKNLMLRYCNSNKYYKEKSASDLHFAKQAQTILKLLLRLADSRDFPYRLSGTIARSILATFLARTP